MHTTKPPRGGFVVFGAAIIVPRGGFGLVRASRRNFVRTRRERILQIPCSSRSLHPAAIPSPDAGNPPPVFVRSRPCKAAPNRSSSTGGSLFRAPFTPVKIATLQGHAFHEYECCLHMIELLEPGGSSATMLSRRTGEGFRVAAEEFNADGQRTDHAFDPRFSSA